MLDFIFRNPNIQKNEKYIMEKMSQKHEPYIFVEKSMNFASGEINDCLCKIS